MPEIKGKLKYNLINSFNSIYNQWGAETWALTSV